MAAMVPIAMNVPDSVGGWMLVFLTLPMIAGIITAAVIDNRLTKSRRLRVGAFLNELGLHFLHDPSPEERSAFFEPIQHLERNAGLQGGAANLKWISYGPIGGRTALIFEHEFVTGSGKHTQVHTRTAVCWVSNLGWLTLIRPFFGEGRALERSHPEIRVADEAFDKDWIIWGEASMADTFITQHVRDLLSNAPRGEMWCIGGGWSCCIYKNALDENNLPKFIQRSGDVLFLNG
jgi:hypothetical protein